MVSKVTRPCFTPFPPFQRLPPHRRGCVPLPGLAGRRRHVRGPVQGRAGQVRLPAALADVGQVQERARQLLRALQVQEGGGGQEEEAAGGLAQAVHLQEAMKKGGWNSIRYTGLDWFGRGTRRKNEVKSASEMKKYHIFV